MWPLTAAFKGIGGKDQPSSNIYWSLKFYIDTDGAQRWYGVVDELTVWDRPLSDEEIANVAKAQ